MDRSQFIGLFWQQPKVQQVAELQELNIGDQLPNINDVPKLKDESSDDVL